MIFVVTVREKDACGRISVYRCSDSLVSVIASSFVGEFGVLCMHRVRGLCGFNILGCGANFVVSISMACLHKPLCQIYCLCKVS